MNVDMAVWPCTLTVEVPSCMCDDIPMLSVRFKDEST